MSMKSLQGRRTPVHAMNAEQRQTAADPWTKPTDLSHWPAYRQHVTTSMPQLFRTFIAKTECVGKCVYYQF